MKKSRLKIESLKVQSFVTTVEVEKANTVKGGRLGPTYIADCETTTREQV